MDCPGIKGGTVCGFLHKQTYYVCLTGSGRCFTSSKDSPEWELVTPDAENLGHLNRYARPACVFVDGVLWVFGGQGNKDAEGERDGECSFSD